MDRSRLALPLIVLAQWCGTSLWFSVNGVAASLRDDLGLQEADIGLLTLAVQLGFIVGTLVIAGSGLADRHRASRIFLCSSLAGAAINLAFVLAASSPALAVALRFATGLCLAGIYPLGMKLVIGWTPKHTGAALAWLVGMLTLGTAMPHLLRGATLDLPWAWTLALASLLAVLGGLAVGLLGDGPHLPHTSGRASLRDGLAAFRDLQFLRVAGGYFGHCWELYAFWMLVPLLVSREVTRLAVASHWTPWLSFAVIAVGALGCIAAGAYSRHYGSARAANLALATSGSLCLLYPLLANVNPALLMLLLMLWGFSVIADSAQFSSLASSAAPKERIGATLSVMNAIGFSLTLPGIWLGASLWQTLDVAVLWLLLPGPLLGLLCMRGVARPA
ncbi:MFS transporter [Halomonas sp. DP8Y7-1]|uniref:MFS transporter n=1 Tax=Halomonas sp. DP8Y7-1 TaxID=2859078 RepID=UPI001C93A140|nr:MFS transporter [Halomonas sp. DP8Y7-1]MBY6030612.1 MFS transporter [Halomonas sp. DP8Y7-1]